MIKISNEDRAFFKRFIFLAIPIIIQELLNTGVNMIDTIMIGRLGIHEVTAVGLANQIFFLFILICFGITGGAAIFTGQFHGKGDHSSIHKVMGISFISSMIVAIVFSSGAMFIPETLMSIYTKDEYVIELAVQYLRPVSISYFFMVFIVTINSVLRSIGQTRFPMITTMVALTVNVISNFLVIFVFELGIAGVAISTIFVRGIELILQLILVFKFKLAIAAPIKSYLSFDMSFVKRFFATAGSVILNTFVWALGTSMYHVAYSYSGTEGQGAMQISSTVQNLFLVISIAIGTTCGIVLANMLGAGEREKAIIYSRKCMVIAVIFSVIMSGLLLLVSPLIINFFEISDVVKDNVRNILYVVSIGMIIKTFNYTAIVGILRSGGDTKFCLLVDLVGVWLVGLPLGLFGAIVLDLPIHFILLMVYGEDVFKAIASSIRVKSNKWANTLVN